MKGKSERDKTVELELCYKTVQANDRNLLRLIPIPPCIYVRLSVRELNWKLSRKNKLVLCRYMNKVHRRWLKLPLTWRLFNAFGSFLVCNTAAACYLVIIVVHGQAACLLTIPLAILVFFWGAITDRKRRLLWTIAIFYVQVIIYNLNFRHSSVLVLTSLNFEVKCSTSHVGRQLNRFR